MGTTKAGGLGLGASTRANRKAVEGIGAAREREGTIRNAVLALVSDDVVWWVAGDRAQLPFAGTWRGKRGVGDFFDALNAQMDYERFEVTETLADGESVVERVKASGKAVATGRPFASDVIRIWTFSAGKAVRVESHYDTGAYLAALGRA
jgi:ketosteroid isomerase-like protein